MDLSNHLQPDLAPGFACPLAHWNRQWWLDPTTSLWEARTRVLGRLDDEP
jgi:hypothetical protein